MMPCLGWVKPPRSRFDTQVEQSGPCLSIFCSLQSVEILCQVTDHPDGYLNEAQPLLACSSFSISRLDLHSIGNSSCSASALSGRRRRQAGATLDEESVFVR